MSQFVEALCVYTDNGGEKHEQRRLINLECVELIMSAHGLTQMHMRQGFAVPILYAKEPYEYWSMLLTSWQSRPA